jgi:hypothetical protein
MTAHHSLKGVDLLYGIPKKWSTKLRKLGKTEYLGVALLAAAPLSLLRIGKNTYEICNGTGGSIKQKT